MATLSPYGFQKLPPHLTVEMAQVACMCWAPWGFSAMIRADGPWEAAFVFCGTFNVRPDQVEVEPMVRHKGHEYTVSVKDVPA
jgi:hypothetical protein